jgi:hypothetical protein
VGFISKGYGLFENISPPSTTNSIGNKINIPTKKGNKL